MKKADKKVKEYLERADGILASALEDFAIDEAEEIIMTHIIEIAKMIQREEHKK